MRKKILERRLAKLMSKRDKLTAAALASQDANEVRSINEQLTDVNDEITDINDELADIAEEEKRAAAPAVVPQNAQLVNGDVRASFSVNPNPTEGKKNTSVNPYETEEYRRAFMNYVQRGAAIPQNLINDITA